jgi:hypothetical protein
MNSNKYRKIWNDYFEGGLSMWSHFGYKYHSYLLTKHIVSKLPIPKNGKLVQLGTGLGITTELLCCLHGEDRVIGYDLFNPLNHPNIRFLDTTKTMPPINDLAYLEIDICSMSDAKNHRKELLLWAMNNMLSGGFILTNKSLAEELKEKEGWKFNIINLNDFDIPELWASPHENRINTKVLLKIQ